MEIKLLISSIFLLIFFSCFQTPKTESKFSGKEGEVKIIQIEPLHSHAGIAQNVQGSQVDTNIYVYAPGRDGLEAYFSQINSYNTRKINPTRWNEVVYTGNDFLDRMVEEKRGNVVVLAGNNRVKIDYIEKSINAGFNVFSDKPMVINSAGFERLKNAYTIAEQKGTLMFDMMTERYSLINRIQKSFMQDTLLFGKVQQGTQDHPAIMESSVHHFYRGGKGNRPYWFFDVLQEGHGIVDVTTHLVDLTFWKTFPDEIIDYSKDVKVLSAEQWPVKLTKREFTTATSLPDIPVSLYSYMKESVLEVFANGSIDYLVKGVHARVRVEWRSETPKDGNDLKNAYAEGTKATLIISQEYGQKRPRLLVKKGTKMSEKDFQINLEQAIARVNPGYSGIALIKESGYAEIVIPEDLELKYDPTFEVFLGYLVKRNLPKWEVPNTLAKYYITTTALEMVKRK